MKKKVTYREKQYDIEFIKSEKAPELCDIVINGINDKLLIYIGGSNFNEAQIATTVKDAIKQHIQFRENEEILENWDGKC